MTYDDYSPVGVGPDYHAIRREALKLLPPFIAPGADGRAGHWGAGLVVVEPVDDGHRASIAHPVGGGWVKDGPNALGKRMTLDELRGSAITLLAYCEAHDPVERKGGAA